MTYPRYNFWGRVLEKSFRIMISFESRHLTSLTATSSLIYLNLDYRDLPRFPNMKIGDHHPWPGASE
jgi:hypothetical protein